MNQESLDHWRGTVDEKLSDHERRLSAINGNVAEGAKAITTLALELGKLATKVGVYAGIGGLVAAAVSSGVTALIVYFLTKGG